MSELEKLIQELCPNGIEFRKVSEVASVERGKRVVKVQLSQESGYPVFQNSLKPMGFYIDFNYPSSTTFVIGAGAAGEVGYSTENFWAADDCFPIVCGNKIQDRYVFHVLLLQKDSLMSKVRKASVPRLSREDIEKLVIPVPPIEVQCEIVRILDNFAKLTAEITAELTTEIEARQKQYEYYRKKLLTFKELSV